MFQIPTSHEFRMIPIRNIHVDPRHVDISLGSIGKYAPNQAINGDMGWKQPEHRQWLAVARKFCRMIHMHC